jgi:hypothetical protein
LLLKECSVAPGKAPKYSNKCRHQSFLQTFRDTQTLETPSPGLLLRLTRILRHEPWL